METSKQDAPAVAGGSPIRSSLLPYARHSIDDSDVAAVVEVLRSDWLTSGPTVRRFEDSFARRVGARHAVSFSSGTAALHAAVFAARLGPGHEAITTPLTFCATANALVYQGATPVFADVTPDTLLLDPARVEQRITPCTRAIVAVDYAGHPAPLAELREIAARHALVLIEDGAHALGASWRGRPVGSLADLTTFSLHPVKHITTGEGGMVTTDAPALAARLRLFRNHGIDSDARERNARGRFSYDMVALGFNYRLPDIGCAIGNSQLARLDENLERRRQIVARYQARLGGLAWLQTPSVKPDVRSAWHLYPIRLESERLRVSRDEVLRALRAEGIGTAVHYPPVHLHSYYRQHLGHRAGEAPIAEAAAQRLASLPLYPAMLDEDVEDVIVAVSRVLAWFAR
jgi:perosamine synthetase